MRIHKQSSSVNCKKRMLSLELNSVVVLPLLVATLMPQLHLQKLKNACDRMSLRWQRCKRLSSRNWLNNKHMMPRKMQKRLRLQPQKPVVDPN